jgi:hypothetical protein
MAIGWDETTRGGERPLIESNMVPRLMNSEIF